MMQPTIEAIQKEIDRQYYNTPDYVHNISYTYKKTGGKETGTLSITFGVDKKKPLHAIPPDELLPHTIVVNGVSIPTDVVEVPRASFLGACYNNWDGDDPEILRLRGVPNALAPMRGGQEIIMFPDNWGPYGGYTVGTLGFFAVDNTDNRIVGVTNTHVVMHPTYYIGDPSRTEDAAKEIFEPKNTVEPRFWIRDGLKYPTGALIADGAYGQNYHHAVLYVKRYSPYDSIGVNNVDAALLIMNNDKVMRTDQYYVDENSYQIWRPTDVPESTAHLPFATTAELDALLPSGTTPAVVYAYSTGRTTGPKGYCTTFSQTKLRVKSVVASISVSDEDKPAETTYFNSLITFELNDADANTAWWSGAQRSAAAVLGGDSGSALLADIGGTRKIIGIVFAGPSSSNTSDYGKVGWACRIDKVASTLNIRAWDSSYTFNRATSLSVPTPRLITRDIDEYGLSVSVINSADQKTYWHAGGTTRRDIVQFAPTDITTFPADLTVLKTAVSGDLIGVFSTVDLDEVDVFTYTLVNTSSYPDNNNFRITAGTNQLRLGPGVTIDPAQKATHSIKVRSTDSRGFYTEKVFTVTAVNVPTQTPTNITLSNNTIEEGNAPNAEIGTFTTTDADLPYDAFTYALISGPGFETTKFTIENNKLKTTEQLIYDDASSYDIRVEVTDLGGFKYQKTFTITVTRQPSAPTFSFATASATTGQSYPVIDFYGGVNAIVGSFTVETKDADSLASDIVFSLPTSGANSENNAQFNIAGLNLRSNANLNYYDPVFDQQVGYVLIKLRVVCTDTRINKSTTQTFTFMALPPSTPAISFTPEASYMFQPANALVGTFSVIGGRTGIVDSDMTYTLVESTVGGSVSNNLFTISGRQLRAINTLLLTDAPSDGYFKVLVRGTDNVTDAFDELAVTIEAVSPTIPTLDFTQTSDEADFMYQPAGAVVATLEPADIDANTTTAQISYSLISISGNESADDHNALFEIVGSELRSKVELRHGGAAAASYGREFRISIRTTDTRTGVFSESAEVVSISGRTAPELTFTPENDTAFMYQPIGTLVGAFDATTIDAGSTTADIEYTLVSGNGDTHNSLFAISGTDINSAVKLTNAAADSDTFYFRVRITDTKTGLYSDSQLTVSVTALSTLSFSLASSYIDSGTTNFVATGDFSTELSTTPYYGAVAFTLVTDPASGTGDDSNSYFEITEATPPALQNLADLEPTNAIYDSGADSYSYNVRIRAENSLTGQTTTQEFVLFTDFAVA